MSKLTSKGAGQALAGVLALAALAGCGSGGGGSATPVGSSVSGSVVLGAVKGAVVYAEHLSGPEANGRIDPDEAATATVTGDDGSFTLAQTPGYPYLLVSSGGVDSITNRSAIRMIAPAGSRNVSPLTTMVALNPAARDRIEALGVAYDDKLTEKVTPAALLLVQSVQASVTALSEVLAPAGAGAMSYSQLEDIQRLVLEQVAARIAAGGVDLTDKSQLTATLTGALSEALTRAKAKYPSSLVVNDADIPVLAGSIAAPAVSNIADAISVKTGSTSYSTQQNPALRGENDLIGDQGRNLGSKIDDTVNKLKGQNLISVQPSDDNGPLILGVPSTSAAPGQSYRFVPTASEPDDDDLVFSIVNKPSWASFNPGTGALTGTPVAADIGVTTGIVISVSDGVKSASLPPFNLTVIVTGSTGSSGL